MWRHTPQTRLFSELIAARSRPGAVIRVAFGFVAWDPHNVGSTPAGRRLAHGRWLLPVSGSRLIAGEPTERIARASRPSAARATGSMFASPGVVPFNDDVTARFDAGLALASQDLLEVVGDAGTLRLTDPWHCRRPIERNPVRQPD